MSKPTFLEDALSRYSPPGSGDFNNLPHELAVETFTFGLHSFEAHSHEAARYLKLITSVCSLWRSIALSVPDLWTGVSWQDFSRLSNRRAADERVAAYLARSQNALIDFRAIISYTPQIEVIRSNAYRLSSLNVVIFDKAMAKQLFPLPSTALQLKVLHVNFEASQSDIPTHSERIQFLEENATPQRLEALNLVGLLAWDFSRIPFWSLRRVLLLTRNGWGDVVTLLSNCTKVNELDVECLSDSFLHAGATFVYPAIHTLGINDTLPLSFYNQFSCPNLETLAIRFSPFRGTWGGPPRPCTWSRLRSVVLNGFDLESSLITSLLYDNPTITSIRLSKAIHLDHFLDFLLTKNNQPGTPEYAFVPDLEQLALWYPKRDASWDTDQHHRMFGQRLENVMLKRASLRVTCRFKPLYLLGMFPALAFVGDEVGDRLERG